jgi:hypothetical protein
MVFCNFVNSLGGLECVGHSFALWRPFLGDIWIRTESAAMASGRAINIATQPSST